MHFDATTAITTLATMLVAGCFRYLGRIDRRLAKAESRDFAQDLHILDLDTRLKNVEPRRSA